MEKNIIMNYDNSFFTLKKESVVGETKANHLRSLQMENSSWSWHVPVRVKRRDGFLCHAKPSGRPPYRPTQAQRLANMKAQHH